MERFLLNPTHQISLRGAYVIFKLVDQITNEPSFILPLLNQLGEH